MMGSRTRKSACKFGFLLTGPFMLILMGPNTGLISAKIVPSPLIRYARENQDTRLECHNVSQSNEFYNFAKNVEWYRLVNGVRHNIRPSNRVYASNHVLFFDPFMSEFDQGQYECCVPQQDCSGPATMTLIVEPIAEVATTGYTGFEGHSVLLVCRIINIGVPPARIDWEKSNKVVINGDIITNDTHSVLILTNLTSSDGGEYKCVVNGPFSLPYKHSVYLDLKVPPKVMMNGPIGMVESGTEVRLTCSQLEGEAANISIVTPSNLVIRQSMITFNATASNTGNYLCVASVLSVNVTASHYLQVYDIDNTTSLIQFTVEIHEGYCEHKLLGKLRELLESVLLDLCQCNVTVTSSGYQCIENTRALYNVTIKGFMAGNIRGFLEYSQLAPKLDLRIATLSVCNQSCSRMISITPTGDRDENDVSTSRNNNLTSILAISFASCAMILLCLILGVLVYKIKQTDKMNTYCVVCSYVQEKSVPTKTDSQICPGSIVEHKSNQMNGDVPNEPVPATKSFMDTIENYSEESVHPMKFKTTLEATEERTQSVSRQDYFHHTDINRAIKAPYSSSEEISAMQNMQAAFTYLSDASNDRITGSLQAKNRMQQKHAIGGDDNNSREVNTTAEEDTTTDREQHYKASL